MRLHRLPELSVAAAGGCEGVSSRRLGADTLSSLPTACGNTKVCKEFKHHLEECGERLAAGKTIVPNETCVEELCESACPRVGG